MHLFSGKKINTLKSVTVIILSACTLASCAYLHAYSIVLASDYDGNKVIENEKNVALYLESVIEDNGDYSMRAFSRKAISPKVRKTPGTTHCFYALYTDDETYHTLSFSATGKWATSKGAWAMDTETDIASYADYLAGDNVWEVEEIIINNGINAPLTLKNILSKIQSDTAYYFDAKMHKNDKHDNCRTALFSTIVENEKQ
jgi:hypothetical protein